MTFICRLTTISQDRIQGQSSNLCCSSFFLGSCALKELPNCVAERWTTRGWIGSKPRAPWKLQHGVPAAADPHSWFLLTALRERPGWALPRSGVARIRALCSHLQFMWIYSPLSKHNVRLVLAAGGCCRSWLADDRSSGSGTGKRRAFWRGGRLGVSFGDVAHPDCVSQFALLSGAWFPKPLCDEQASCASLSCRALLRAVLSNTSQVGLLETWTCLSTSVCFWKAREEGIYTENRFSVRDWGYGSQMWKQFWKQWEQLIW